MRTHDDYFLRSKRTTSRLRRAVVVSLFVHAAILCTAGAIGYFWKSASEPLGFQMEFLAKGLRDAPEGIETTRVEGLPPGPPEQKPAPSVAPPEKKQEPKEPDPKPEVKEPEPPKPEPKPEPPKPDPKPVPKKEEPKKEDPKKEKPEPPKKEAKEDPKKEKKDDKKPKLPSLDDDVLAKAMDDDFPSLSNPATEKPGGGLEGARVSTKAQTGYGDINSNETGISVKGVPHILGTWVNQVRRKVQRYWNEPGGVGISNQVIISFWVARDGSLIGEPEVSQPSNDASLDESGLQAVRLAAPFPPLPPQFTETRQQVLFIFNIAG